MLAVFLFLCRRKQRQRGQVALPRSHYSWGEMKAGIHPHQIPRPVLFSHGLPLNISPNQRERRSFWTKQEVGVRIRWRSNAGRAPHFLLWFLLLWVERLMTSVHECLLDTKGRCPSLTTPPLSHSWCVHIKQWGTKCTQFTMIVSTWFDRQRANVVWSSVLQVEFTEVSNIDWLLSWPNLDDLKPLEIYFRKFYVRT